MKRTVSEITNLFEQIAQKVAEKCSEAYKVLCQSEQIDGVGEVRMLRYEKYLLMLQKS